MVLVSHGPPEICQHAVSEIFGDVATKARDRAGDAILIAAGQLVHVFRVELRRKRGRADQVTEEHAEKPSIGSRFRRDFGAEAPTSRSGLNQAEDPSRFGCASPLIAASMIFRCPSETPSS